MWSLTPYILKRAFWIGAYCNTNCSFGIVCIVNMHPHYVLLCAIIVNDLRSLNYICEIQVTALVSSLCFEGKPQIMPSPEVLG
jgi:hypothetical protein